MPCLARLLPRGGIVVAIGVPLRDDDVDSYATGTPCLHGVRLGFVNFTHAYGVVSFAGRTACGAGSFTGRRDSINGYELTATPMVRPQCVALAVAPGYC